MAPNVEVTVLETHHQGVVQNGTKEGWTRRRRRTFIAFTIYFIGLGMEYSMTFSTLWLYLQTEVKPDHPLVYYCIISAVYYVTTILFSLITGRIVDKYRTVRATCLFCTGVTVIGNILYSLPYSPYFLLSGRLLAGAGGALRSVQFGEVARIYPDNETHKKFATLSMCFCIGYLGGPAINLIFVTVDVTIGTWHITYANAIGVFMAGVFLVIEVILFFMAFDISKEYDPKAASKQTKKHDKNASYDVFEKPPSMSKPEISKPHNNTLCVDTLAEAMMDASKSSEQENDYTPNHVFLSSIQVHGFLFCSMTFDDEKAAIAVSPKETQFYEKEPLLASINHFKPPSMRMVLSKMFSSIESSLIMIATMVFIFSVVSCDMWLPLLLVDEIGWGVMELSGVMFARGLSCALFLLVLSLKPLNSRSGFMSSLIGIVGTILVLMIIAILSQNHRYVSLNVTFLAIYALCFGYIMAFTELFLTSTLAKMSPSSIQSFAESVRLSFNRCGALLALLISALLYTWVVEVVTVLSALLTAWFILFLVRRKHLISPKPLF